MISTSWPTTVRRRADPTGISPAAGGSSDGSSTSSWIRRAGEPEVRSRFGLVGGLRARRWGVAGLFQHFLNYLDEEFLRRGDPEAYQRNGIRVIAAGPNALLYVLDASGPLDAPALEQRLPGLAEELSRSPGVGFVLARSGGGPALLQAGQALPARRVRAGTVRGSRGRRGGRPGHRRPHDDAERRGPRDLRHRCARRPRLVHPEMGAHAGPSPEEMHTFIVRPANVTLPSPISHPVQLYDHFIRYQDTSGAPGDAAGPAR